MKALTLPRFSRAEVIFSVKCFVAAMLAMYVASRMGQPRPFWAMLTTYVVASPLAGAVRSKALYRFLGTLLGCAAAVVLVPPLSNAPELLTLALALWVGLCLYFSLQDRTPRSYVFMLAGYTVALVGFPSVDAPLQLFDTAVARVEEIGLGILAATVVHSIVLPTGLGPAVLGLLDRSLGDARHWLLALMQPPAAGAVALSQNRQRVAADITQLRLLSTHIPFDTTHLRWTVGAVHAVQDRVAALTPALSAVEDRLDALSLAEGEIAADVTAMLAQIAQWLQALDAASPQAEATLARLRQSIQSFGVAADLSLSPWSRALRLALAERLDELVQGWRDCTLLRQEVDAGLAGTAPPSRRIPSLGSAAMHLDVGMALLSSLAAVIAVCLCGAFWILSGWPSGAAAVMMAAVFCSFFASMDDPVPAIHSFLKYTLWSVPLSAVYVLLLLPAVHDFGMLVAVCAPVFLLLGCYVARPATAGMALPILVGVASALALHDTATADLVSFTNSMIAQVIGIVVAARITRLMRSVGADWSARRIQRATWRELAEMAAAPRVPAQAAAYAVRMLDRTALLAPRIAASGGSVAGVSADALLDLRVGADIVALQHVRSHFPQAAGNPLMADLARLFRERIATHGMDNPPALLTRIDAALAAAMDVATAGASRASPELRSAISALVGLRRNLFPSAAPLYIAPAIEGGAA